MAKKLREIPASIHDMPPLIEQQLLRRFLQWAPTTFERRKKIIGFPKPFKFGDSMQSIVYYHKHDVIEWLNNLNNNSDQVA